MQGVHSEMRIRTVAGGILIKRNGYILSVYKRLEDKYSVVKLKSGKS